MKYLKCEIQLSTMESKLLSLDTYFKNNNVDLKSIDGTLVTPNEMGFYSMLTGDNKSLYIIARGLLTFFAQHPQSFNFIDTLMQYPSLTNILLGLKHILYTKSYLNHPYSGLRKVMVNTHPHNLKKCGKLKVLSYNVYYKATKGEHMLCKDNNICLTNMANIIDKYGPYDFVALQEASNWRKLQKRSKVLNNMNSRDNYISKKKQERMVTFWSKRYTLTKYINTHLGKWDRPLNILFFEDREKIEKICFINLHCNHFDVTVNNYISNSSLSIDIQVKNALKSHNLTLFGYRIIIAGDFNRDVPTTFHPSNTHKVYGSLKPGSYKYIDKQKTKTIANIKTKYGVDISPVMDNFEEGIIIDGVKVYNSLKRPYTCCDTLGLTNTFARSHHADHILDSAGYPNSVKLAPIEPASDHSPVLALLKL
jgi:exonuclease III